MVEIFGFMCLLYPLMIVLLWKHVHEQNNLLLCIGPVWEPTEDLSIWFLMLTLVLFRRLALDRQKLYFLCLTSR